MLPTRLLKITWLLFAGLIVLMFYPAFNPPVAAQPETCDPDAPMRVVWPPDSAVTTEDTSWQLSADGRYTLFSRRIVSTPGPYLNYLYRYDRLTCAVEDVAIDVDGQPVIGDYFPDVGSMSADGRYIAFDGDNALYLRDMELQTTVEVVNFYTGFHSLSADGRYLAYWAFIFNDGDNDQSGVFVYDQVNDTHEAVVPYMPHPDNSYFHPVISSEGRYVAILSTAALVAGDTNGFTDLFLYDLDTQTMVRVTEGYDGSQANGESEFIPDISADGRYIVFGSFASNLVPGDNNGAKDIFLYDRVNDSIERLNVNALGVEANGGSSEWFYSISADGRYVAFDSTATNLQYGASAYASVYVLDRDTGLLKLVTVTPDGEGGEGGAGPLLSDDGHFVAFMSRATDLAPGNDSGDIRVFLADWQQLPTPLPGVLQPETCDPDASVNVLLRNPENLPHQLYLPFISDDGRYVAYDISSAISGTWVVPYRYDRVTCKTEIISITGDATPYTGDFTWSKLWGLSGDGRYALFDTSINRELSQLYVQDMDTGTVEKIPVGNPFTFAAISRDGRHVLYTTYVPSTSGIPDSRAILYLYNRDTGESELISASGERGEDVFFFGSISADNNLIVFNTNVNAPVPGENYDKSSVFIYDRRTHEQKLITTGSDGSPVLASEFPPTISANGRYVVYPSREDNPGTLRSDIFVYDHQTNITRRIPLAENGVQGNGEVGYEQLSISGDGRYITFASNSPNLIAGETHNTHSVYIYDQIMEDLWRVNVEDYYTDGVISDYNPVLSRDGQWLAYETRQETDHFSTDLFIVEWQTLIDGEIEEPTPLPTPPQPEVCDPDASVTVLLRDPDNFESYPTFPHISDDGRYVAYSFDTQISGTSVTIPYRYDRVTCETDLISITGDATPYTSDLDSAYVWSLSGDGRYALFEFMTRDTILKGIYIQDMDMGTVEKIPAENAAFVSSISRDGRYVLYTAYIETTSGIPDNPDDRTSLFLYDRETGESELIYAAEAGVRNVLFFASIAEDNNRIVFSTNANQIVPDENIYTLTDVFVYNRATQELNLITTGSDGSPPYAAHYSLAVSANGRYVVYSAWVESVDNNGSRDVFVYDQLTHTTRRISVAADGSQGNGPSGHEFVSISADGRFIAFSSDATNLIVGETHDTRGVYVYDQFTDHLWRVSVDDYYSDGVISNANPMLSRDGQWLVYTTSQQVGGQYGVDLFIVEWQTLIDGGIEEPTPSEPDAAPQRNLVISGESLLIWSEITWAVAYEIQIDNDADFSSPISSDNALNDTYLTVPDLPNGVFYWRVRAQRSNGSWGGWSAVDSFAVGAP